MMQTAFTNPYSSGVFCDNMPLSHIDIPEGKAPRNLLRSIREQGLIEPPVLLDRGDGSGQLGILAGIRRLQAIRELAPQGAVTAIIRSDRLASPGVTLTENLVRSRNLLSELDAYLSLLKQGMDDDDIQNAMGIFKRDLNTLNQLSHLGPKAKAFLGEGKIAPSSAKVLAKLSIKDQDAFFSEHGTQAKYTLASVKAWRMHCLLPNAQLSFLKDMPLS